MAMKENRQFPRYQKAVVVDFTSEQSRMTGLTRDVSLEGMFIRTMRPPDEGRPIRVTLRFSNRELTVPGVVVRTFHASPLDRDSPSGFALAVRNGDSYKNFVESVALSG
jgi:PilZ domain